MDAMQHRTPADRPTLPSPPYRVYAALALVVAAVFAHLLTFVQPSAAPFLLWPSLLPSFIWMLARKMRDQRAAKARAVAHASPPVAAEAETARSLRSTSLSAVFMFVMLPYLLFCLAQTGPKGHQEIAGDRCRIVLGGVTKQVVTAERCKEYDNAQTRFYSVIAVLIAVHLSTGGRDRLPRPPLATRNPDGAA